MALNMRDIIADKRYSKELTDEQIEFFVNGVTDGSIPDYQISALLMAIVLNGMTDRETTTLTLKMASSGEQNDLSYLGSKAVDKHSTGGVGDKCTPILLALVGSFGINCVKLSGRGLGFTGGTVDKFESIVGFNPIIEYEDFEEMVKRNGVIISGQSPNLAPADKVLYALRDVTSTIDSIPLIASSIMSKKIAGGAQAIVLDVTCGQGAFMKTIEQARELSKSMIEIGKLSGRQVVCVITSMDEPLGHSIGNTLEMMEVYETLTGKGSEDLLTVVTTLAAYMIDLSESDKVNEFFGHKPTIDELITECRQRLSNNMALNAYANLILGQGGNIDSNLSPVYVDYPAEAIRLTASSTGYISAIKADVIGNASVELGAGRLTKESQLDYGAGITLYKKIGDFVKKGDVVCVLYKGSNATIDEDKLWNATELAADAFEYSEVEVPKHPVILDVLT